MATATGAPPPPTASTTYAIVWRWHFYAGLYVAPFLMLLALSGLLMLSKRSIERWQFGPWLTNSAPGSSSSHQARWDAAQAARPDATVVRYQPGRDRGESSRVTLAVSDRTYTAFVDASTATVVGIVDDGHRLSLVPERVHGTLLAGSVGDRLVEIAASLAILLLVSGLYLWFPGFSAILPSFSITRGNRRLAWRDLHRSIGAIVSPVLLFYLISGLAWTGVWGERIVQSWSSLRSVQSAPGEDTSHGHGALNATTERVVPWAVEQTPLPHAGHHAEGGTNTISLDQAITIAAREGIGTRFWVAVPPGADHIWSIGQTAMNEDITDPTRELIVHVDRRSGEVIGRAGWSDYGLVARAMAAGIPFHMGALGWWNYLGAMLVCVSVLALSVTGLVTWWLRRPSRVWRLAAPARPARIRLPVAVWVVATFLAVAFPMAGVTIAAVFFCDWLIVSRVGFLRAFVR